jgi:hypothetical protein
MLFKTLSAALFGIDAFVVDVDLTPGIRETKGWLV